MKILKFFIILVVICCYQNLNAQQDNSETEVTIANKNVLVVWGGWDGHQPEKFAKKISKWAKSVGANVTVTDTLEIYTDSVFMEKQDLIIQYWTMGTINDKQSKGLIKAIQNGTGLVGCHGGIGDSFRQNPKYQYVVGGQWVAHPGGKINYTVEIGNTDDPVTKGIEDFEITNTEQYYMHIDPNVKVLARTRFTGEHDYWIDGAVMPVVWKKMFDKGRIFYISIGHNPEDFDHPAVWTMLTRGIDWAAEGKALTQ